MPFASAASRYQRLRQLRQKPARFIRSMFCTSVRSRRCSTRRRNAAASSSVRVGGVEVRVRPWHLLLLHVPAKMARRRAVRHTRRRDKSRRGDRRPHGLGRRDARARPCARCSMPRSPPPTRAACWPRHLPPKPTRAAASWSAAANPPRSWPPRWKTPGPTSPLEGTVVTRYGHAVPTRRIEVIEASHPVPDANSERGARRLLERVHGLGPDDLVMALMSGGASALLAAPAPGLTLADKQAVNRALLACGRQHRRDELRAEASVRDQGRPAGRRGGAGAGGDAGDQRRAGRRPGGDRLRPDRAGPHHLRRRARPDRALRHHALAGRRRAAGAGRRRNAEARQPAAQRFPPDRHADDGAARRRPRPRAASA